MATDSDVDSLVQAMSALDIQVDQCNNLRRTMHALIDAKCDTLIKQCTSCPDSATVHSWRQCRHTGMPHIHVNNKAVYYARLFIHELGNVSFGYTCVDLSDHCISMIAEHVISSQAKCLVTPLYRVQNGVVVTIQTGKCDKEKGKHKHIPIYVLGMYGTCHTFKRVLDQMFLT